MQNKIKFKKKKFVQRKKIINSIDFDLDSSLCDDKSNKEI